MFNSMYNCKKIWWLTVTLKTFSYIYVCAQFVFQPFHRCKPVKIDFCNEDKCDKLKLRNLLPTATNQPDRTFLREN